MYVSSVGARSRIAALFPLFALLLVVPMSAQKDAQPTTKDLLVFTNGDQLSGTLKRSAGGSVLFQSDMAGEITVPLTKIRELRTSGAFAVLKRGAPIAESRSVQPGKIVLSSTEVTVSTNDGGTGAVVPVSDVAYLVDAATFRRDLAHAPSLWEGWDGSANLGTTLTQSTIHGGTVTAGVSLDRQVPTVRYLRARSRTLLSFQENYGVLTTPGFIAGTGTDVEAKTSILHAEAERDQYVRKSLFLYGTTSFDHNYAQSLELQQIYGFGTGYTPIRTDTQQLDLKADLHYERQHFFRDVGNQNLIGSDFSEHYRRVLPLKLTVTQAAAILPAWNNLNAYAANGSVALVAPLFRRLSINVTATDSFLNNPVPGYQKNSFTLSSGLTYTLR